MSKFLKVMIVLLTIAAFAAPAMSATIVEKDGFKFSLTGDIQIQFDQDGDDGDKVTIENDDVEINYIASYEISDGVTVGGKLDADNNGTDVPSNAFIFFNYNNVSLQYGTFWNVTDGFGVELAMENDFSVDAFDVIAVATSYDGIQGSVSFSGVTLTVAHELDSAAADGFTVAAVTASFSGLSVAAMYGDNAGLNQDAFGISAKYDAGVVAVGADYSTSDDADRDFYNVAVSAPVGDKTTVAVGYSVDDNAGTENDSFYVNGAYKLASGAKVFAEVRDNDLKEDIAFTAGLQVKF